MSKSGNIKPLHHRRKFVSSVIRNSIVASGVICVSLFIGIAGYMYFFDISFVDGLLNASMILTGMGPVDKAITTGAKVFSSFYALYSGIAFLSSVGIIFAPLFQRFMHRFHLDINE